MTRTEWLFARFGAWCLKMAREDGGSNLDGGILQDCALELGLLHHVEVKEPCCEDGCWCAEYYGEFPAKCLRMTVAAHAFAKEMEADRRNKEQEK